MEYLDDPGTVELMLNAARAEAKGFAEYPPVPFVVPAGSYASWLGGDYGYVVNGPEDAAKVMAAGELDIWVYVYHCGGREAWDNLALPFAIRPRKLKRMEVVRYLEVLDRGAAEFSTLDCALVYARLLRLLPACDTVIPMFVGCDHVVFDESGNLNAAWIGL
jgi:hypothetical protein